MKPPAFEYFKPCSLDETLDLLAEHADNAKVLAGGQSLVPMLNLRLVRPACLIDINGVSSLSYITSNSAGLEIGALTRQRSLERSSLVADMCPLINHAVEFVAHFQIRNRGTLGGSLAHADPAAELPAAVTALGSELVVRSARGERTLQARSFFTGYLETALAPDELLVAVRIPREPPRSGSAFMEVSRRHGDFALVGVAARVTLGADGMCEAAVVVLVGVDAAPFLATEASELLVGTSLSASDLSEAARAIAARVPSQSDIHASAAYRQHAARTLTARALAQAAGRARASAAHHEQARSHRVTAADSRREADAAARASEPAKSPVAATSGRRAVQLCVNGAAYVHDAEPRRLLVDFLRDDLGLTGTHIGCEHGICGACTVIVNGDAVRSCLQFAVQADGAQIDTVEGLAAGGKLHALQESFREHHALQCGFCTPGILMSCVHFLREFPRPSEAQIRIALAGNLCRCTGYRNIERAIAAAAERVAAES